MPKISIFNVASREAPYFRNASWARSAVGSRRVRCTSGTSLSRIPARSPESQAMARELKKRGFRFLGPTILYAFMQAVGMVDDHVEGCFRYVKR